MSPPWMPLYIGDYLSDTGHLTAAQHGAYLLLIMHYWRNGKLPAETKQKASIARMRLEDWNRNVEVIQAFFEIDEGGAWRHARILAELERCREKRTKRAEAGRLGGLEKARKNSSNATNLLKQNPTNHNHSHKEEEERRKKDAAPGAARDVRADLFSTGLKLLAEISGKTPDSCRSLLGKWLKLVDDEAIHILAAVEDAHRNRVADPVAWIFERLRPKQSNGGRINGHRQHPAERAFQLADELDAALERQADTTGSSSGSGPDAISLLNWQRSS